MSDMNTTILSNVPNEPEDWFRIFLILIFVFILIVGFTGNCLVLLFMRANQNQIRRSSTNLLLVNMSCADLIILIFNIFDIVQFAIDPFWPTAWYLGLPLCKLVRFGQVFGCYVSIQTLLAISIERYISIIHPIKISRITRRNRRCIIFALIWSLGFLVALPNLYLLKLHPFYNRPRYFICGLSDHWNDSHLMIVYKYIESVVFFFLPAFIQTILYIIICQKIFSIDRVVQAQSQSFVSDDPHLYSEMKLSSSFPSPLINNQNRSTSQHSQISRLSSNQANLARKKAIVMLLIVASLYFIAFSPSQINFLSTQIHHFHHLYEHRLFFIVSILLALSSTAFNPILFYIFSKDFRWKFNLLFHCICASRRENDQLQMNKMNRDLP